ncbi:MAG: hypothetical protein OHK006_19190 [Thermodesulfovibrionales bacterium]
MADKAAIIKEAQKFLAKGQVDKAIAEWEKLVREAPDGNTYNIIGDLYLKNNDRNNANASYKRAAMFFRHEGFSQKALALFKKVLNTTPGDSDSLYALGELSEEKGVITDAIKYYLATADILSKEGRKDKLLDIYEKILSLSPANIPLRAKVAEIFLKEGLKSDSAREYVTIAKLYDEKGEAAKAKEFYQKAIDVQPLSKDAFLGLSALYEKAGDIAKAFEVLKEAAVIFPEDTDVLFRSAEVSFTAGKLDNALAYLERIKGHDPNNIKARRMLGDIFLKKNDKKSAWQEYLPVLDEMLVNMNFDQAIGFIEMFKEVEPFDTARRLISLYRQLNEMPSVAAELTALGNAYREQGREEEALASYREALEITPDDVYLKQLISGPDFETAEHQAAAAAEDWETEILKQGAQPTAPAAEPAAAAQDIPFPDIDLSAAGGPAGPEIGPIEVEPAVQATPAAKKPAAEHVTIRGQKTVDEVFTEADIFARYGLVHEAQKLLEGIRDSEADNIDLHVRLKAVYEDLGDKASAVAECLALNELYGKAGNRDAADQALRDAFELNPADPRLAGRTVPPLGGAATLAGLGATPSREGASAETIEDLDEELAEADFYSRQGLMTEALKILEKLQRHYPDNAEIAEKLSALGKMPEVGQLEESSDFAAAESGSGFLTEEQESLMQAGTDRFFFEEPAVPEEEAKPAEERAFFEEAPFAPDAAGEGLSIEPPSAAEPRQPEPPAGETRGPEPAQTFEPVFSSEPEITLGTTPDLSVAAPEEPAAPPAAAPEAPSGGSEPAEFESLTFTDEDLVEAQEVAEPVLENDVLDIFQEFKKGLETEIDKEDSETHYNLGIAYKEMGLIDDAITEFQVSKNDPKRFVQSSTMLGICYMEKGLYSLAVDVLSKVLENMSEADDSYWAVKYDLAEAYAKNQNYREAIDLFTEVYGWNAKFRDVAGHLAHCRAQAGSSDKPAKPQSAQKPKERKDRVSYL